MLSDRLLERLMCPVCGGSPLDLAVEEMDGDTIRDANLGCPGCKRWYPVRNDISRIMPPDLASNLSASDERWEGWAATMLRFLQWRESAWGEAEAAAQRREAARAMHERFIDFCALPAAPLTLLDVGGGTGHVADLLPESVEYMSVDPLPGGVSPTGNLPPEMPRPARAVSFVQGVGEMLPFVDGCFDAVLVMGTLDHCRDAEEMLAQSVRVLRPGGTLGVLQGITSQPETGGIGAALRSLARSLTGQDDPGAVQTHMRRFSSVQEVASLVSAHLNVCELTEDSGRAFLRATAGGEA